MQWQSPNNCAIVSESMEAKRMPFDRTYAKDADINEFAVMGKAVVEKFLPKETVEPRNIRIERCQLLPSLIERVLAPRVTQNANEATIFCEFLKTMWRSFGAAN
jgi:hypothetical protein